MKNLTLFSIMISLAVIFTNCGSNSDGIDSKFLTSNTFSDLSPQATGRLNFKENKTYTISFRGEEGIQPFFLEGEWEVKDNTVLLHPKKCFDSEGGTSIDLSLAWGEAVCTIKDSELPVLDGGFAVVIFTKYLEVKLEKETLNLGIDAFKREATDEEKKKYGEI